MNALVLDVETTVFQKGNPYSQQNKLCLVGTTENIYDIEYSGNGYKDKLEALQKEIHASKVLVVFNGKFDLAWLRRYNIDISSCSVWDCQLVHFILSGQTVAYPSLNQVAEHYGLGQKEDQVKLEYWDNGVDTPNIPRSVLDPYLRQDVALTMQVYQKQLEEVSKASYELQKLIAISNMDLLVLLEMEFNGIKLDFSGMEREAIVVEQQINTIKEKLNEHFTNIPSRLINYNSGDCLSSLLYGGTITETIRTCVGQYKSGAKLGQDRFSLSEKTYLLPRLFEPPKGSALKKDGYYATNEATLRSIKANKTDRVLLDQLLELSKLEKLNGTYYKGLKDLHTEKDWEPNFIHGQFNQCVAKTGRLSSNGPNLQNFTSEMDQFTVSQYD